MGLLVVDYYIAGYSASQIAQLRLGTGATVDTGANYSSWGSNLAAAATAGTSRVSGTGVPVAQAAQTNGRRGGGTIHNHSGQNKTFALETVCYSAQAPTAASAMASMATVVGCVVQHDAGAEHRPQQRRRRHVERRVVPRRLLVPRDLLNVIYLTVIAGLELAVIVCLLAAFLLERKGFAELLAISR
jgi:hypothetical protein